MLILGLSICVPSSLYTKIWKKNKKTCKKLKKRSKSLKKPENLFEKKLVFFSPQTYTKLITEQDRQSLLKVKYCTRAAGHACATLRP